MNIALFLQMAADAEPERIGLVCDGRRWSYGALRRAAQGAATNIRNSSCAYVALLDESSEAAAIALFGAALAGIPYVPLNYRLADADLSALLGRIAPACVIGDVERVQRLSGAGGHTCLSRLDFVKAAGTEAVYQPALQELERLQTQYFEPVFDVVGAYQLYKLK